MVTLPTCCQIHFLKLYFFKPSKSACLRSYSRYKKCVTVFNFRNLSRFSDYITLFTSHGIGKYHAWMNDLLYKLVNVQVYAVVSIFNSNNYDLVFLLIIMFLKVKTTFTWLMTIYFQTKIGLFRWQRKKLHTIHTIQNQLFSELQTPPWS